MSSGSPWSEAAEAIAQARLRYSNAKRTLPRGPADGRPKLRLVRDEPVEQPASAELPVRFGPPAAPPPPAIKDPLDARWVLAVRAAQSLQGPILTPERREHLLNVGKRVGLTPFDANLVLAIVQDQARRGVAASLIPSQAEPQLRLVPPPRAEKRAPRWHVVALVASSLIIEAGLLWYWLA